MGLGKHTVDALKRLATGEVDLPITLEVNGAHARLDLADHDRYSVALRALEVVLDPRTAPADARGELHARSAELTRQLGYLEEPLAVWELEDGERTAQLRSAPPQREGESLFYWEVTLRGGATPAASIARYHWAPGMPEREQVVYPATFALIGRLAASLEAALAAPVE